MSWQPAKEPAVAAEPSPDPVEMAIVPRTRDLGDGFQVRRVLPFVNRRMVGPFIFFDAMGPTLFEAGHGLDVRPHPHIGLATVTYLFAGEIIHRDSLGNVQPIRPGDVNWMTAGRGIALKLAASFPAYIRLAGEHSHDAIVIGALPWRWNGV